MLYIARYEASNSAASFRGQRSRRQACAHSSDPKVSLATLSGAQGPLSANAVGVRQTRMEFWIMLFAMTMA